MGGDAERVVGGWSRGEPGEPGYEQVLIVRRGAAWRVRWVGRVRVPDVKAVNEWSRVTPPTVPRVPSPRGPGRLEGHPATAG